MGPFEFRFVTLLIEFAPESGTSECLSLVLRSGLNCGEGAFRVEVVCALARPACVSDSGLQTRRIGHFLLDRTVTLRC